MTHSVDIIKTIGEIKLRISTNEIGRNDFSLASEKKRPKGLLRFWPQFYFRTTSEVSRCLGHDQNRRFPKVQILSDLVLLLLSCHCGTPMVEMVPPLD